MNKPSGIKNIFGKENACIVNETKESKLKYRYFKSIFLYTSLASKKIIKTQKRNLKLTVCLVVIPPQKKKKL